MDHELAHQILLSSNWGTPDHYFCGILAGRPCSQVVHGSRNSLRRHLKKEHGVIMNGTKVPCTWLGCLEQQQGGNLPRHILRHHLGFRWECSHCTSRLPRDDAIRRHRDISDEEGCKTATAVVFPGPGGVWI
ncbi:hypothetical protein BV22DRAFT_64228 [Leucogyrophana mollusca]|uniref:Uncharacterized protein n=1 Tax=Leucogyrophana mollusca TaxID=85980 RepID=A0ACB8BY66_9AGAM|nr:hypothetical protein BV22DRAFT_64228 [Leucogyrophana mollusca]